MSSQHWSRTYQLDAWRGFFDGFAMAAAHQGIVLVVVLTILQKGDAMGSVVAAAPFLGNLLSLFYTSIALYWFGSCARSATVALSVAAGAFALAAVSSGVVFVVAVTLAMVSFTLRVPFLVSLYDRITRQHNVQSFSPALR